jgi:hypothetical protein
MSKATACPPSVVADTIMRTIELGVTITDAAVDEEVTTIFCRHRVNAVSEISAAVVVQMMASRVRSAPCSWDETESSPMTMLAASSARPFESRRGTCVRWPG